MKNILFLLFVFLYPVISSASVDERKTDIYFANGILTKRYQAKNNAEKILEPSIRNELYNSEDEMYKHIGKVGYAYNETHKLHFDLLESILQKTGLQGVLDLFFDTSHKRDLANQIDQYDSSIKSGHKVLVVAHSQGNLFTYEAYRGIDSWMKEYFEVVSVASPAMFSVKQDTPLISWDNDLVAYLGVFNSSMVSNDVRKVSWKVYDNSLGIEKPDQNYVYSRQEGKTYQDSWKAVEGFTDTFDTNVHAFTFYMGREIKDADSNESFINPFDGKTLHYDAAKIEIMAAINHKLLALEGRPSQWKVLYEDTLTPVCEGRRSDLTHLNNAVDPISLAYPFNTENGKVYQVGGAYVFASVDGTEIVDVQTDEDDRCYELKGTAKPDLISIENTCESLMFKTQYGVLESTLSWINPEIDLDLSVSFKGISVGVRDIISSESGCPQEHWYLTEDGVVAGEYYVSVNRGDSNSTAVTAFPETISFSVNASGGGVEFKLDIQNADDLNMGEIAKVTVTEKNNPDGSVTRGTIVEPTDTIKSNVTVRAGIYILAKDGVRYDYKTESLLNRVNFGPIAGAFFEVTRFTSPEGVIYSGSTSTGSTIDDNGLMLFSSVLKDAVEDDSLYLITATGGEDIDADDNFVMDSIPTTNLGKIHAIVSGADIRDGRLKINIATEIAYQVLSKSSETNITKIQMGLDTIAEHLFREDINGDKEINRTDLHTWIAGFDKQKLLLDYSSDIEPIVQKVYLNEDIYEDVNNLIPSIRANAGRDISIGQTQLLILDASKSYSIHGDIVNYRWSDGSSLICESDQPICKPKMLDFGKHSITLRVTDDDGKTAEDIVLIDINAFVPVARAGTDQEIFNTGDIRLDASSSYDSNGEIVEYTWSRDGTIYCKGNDPVCLVENLSVADYTFRLTVTDDDGNRAEDFINVTYPYKPIAVAGPAISIDFGETVVLDASGSYDNDGYIVRYSWEKSGEVYCEGTESSCTIEGLHAGLHRFTLIVTDNYGTVGYDHVEVKVASKPYTVGFYDTTGYTQDVVLSADENIAYIADGSNGVQIIDISNSTTPALVGNYKTPGYAFDLTSSDDGKSLYVADAGSGLIILDISNPTVPVFVGNYSTYEGYDIEISDDGNVAYLADGFSGLQIIDIRNPSTPLLLGTYDTLGDAYNVTISTDGTIAYVADYNSGFHLIDITDSKAPVLLSSYDTSGYTQHIKLSLDGNIAYIADGSNGLLIFDVSDPVLPFMIGSYKTPDAVHSIKLSIDGTVAYLASAKSGIEIINVSTPSTPFIIGEYNSPGTALNISLVQGDTIMYIADGSSGLQIVDVSAFVSAGN